MRLVAAAVCALLAGCSGSAPDSTPCHPAIPPASAILADPAMATLTFHKGQPYDPRRGVGYELWGDSRFDYRTGLEYALVPAGDGAAEGRLCTNAITMRLSLPADETAPAKLAALARNVAPGVGIDAAALQSRLSAVLASGDKYRARGAAGAAELQAGKLMHPSRGEFFMATFTWPRPQLTAK